MTSPTCRLSDVYRLGAFREVQTRQDPSGAFAVITLFGRQPDVHASGRVTVTTPWAWLDDPEVNPADWGLP